MYIAPVFVPRVKSGEWAVVPKVKLGEQRVNKAINKNHVLAFILVHKVVFEVPRTI